MINYELIGKALLYPTQEAILEQAQAHDVVSPNELSLLLDLPLGNVSYHVLILAGGSRARPSRFKDSPLLELADEQPRRGAMEHYYRLAKAVTTPERTAAWLGKQIEAMEAEIEDLAADARGQEPAVA